MICKYNVYSPLALRYNMIYELSRLQFLLYCSYVAIGCILI